MRREGAPHLESHGKGRRRGGGVCGGAELVSLLLTEARPMRRLLSFIRPITAAGLCWLASLTAFAQSPETASTPTTEQRLAALEAYVNNGDPGATLTGVAGPGHNGWMMTSAA